MSQAFSFTRFRIHWMLVIIFADGFLQAQEQGRESHLLTTVEEVRALSREEARRVLPAKIRGVYMGESRPKGSAFFLQDETACIYVFAPPEFLVAIGRGDLIEIVGVTDPGGFAPIVRAHQLTKLGEAEIPQAVPVRLDELNSGQMDAKWVEISGVVRSVVPWSTQGPLPFRDEPHLTRKEDSQADAGNFVLKLAQGSSRLLVTVDSSALIEDLVDAEIKLQGLCFNLHNQKSQFLGPLVGVPAGVEIEVIVPSPNDPFDGRVRPVASLMRFESLLDRTGHRVHVRGVVVHHRPGIAFWVRDGEDSLRVESTRIEPLFPGDEVDVLGFPALGDYSPILEDAEYRIRSKREVPMPVPVETVSDALRYDSNLVRFEARLIELQRFPERAELKLDWQGTNVRAVLYGDGGGEALADWLPGSFVSIAGVCSASTDLPRPLGGLWAPESIDMLLRTAEDLEVIQSPPWWNAERIAWLLLGVLALAFAAIAMIIVVSRRRLRIQEGGRVMAEAEFSAILRERNRAAREIHDTLSQSITAISMQLELTKTHLREMGVPVVRFLETAHTLAREALTEARNSIWNMRSQVLEKCDLGEALGHVLAQLTEGTGIERSIKVVGTPRRLPPIAENNLLRIGQEAIMNARKHANPKHINVEVAFVGRSVRLTVFDDGSGIIGEAKEKNLNSFGLVGIHERAALIGGEASVDSVPGEGTKVVLNVSI